jgi:prenyltransferase beta subunit
MLTQARGLAVLCLVLVLILSPMLPAASAAPAPTARPALAAQTGAIDAALSWLLAQQAADGSFPSAFDPTSATLDAVLAGAAAGLDVSAWRSAPGAPTALDYLHGAAGAYATTASTAGKLAVALAAAGPDPSAYLGRDLATQLLGYLAPSGSLGTTLADQAWGMLGLAALRQPVPAACAPYLITLQKGDGGWAWQAAADSDTNSTAVAVQALIAAGLAADDAAIAGAMSYVKSQQDATGGFGFMASSPADPSSTATVLQALVAAGAMPLEAPWLYEGASALDALLAMQLAGGAYPGYDGSPDVMVTSQTILGLVARPLPYASRALAVRDALAYLRGLQTPHGSVDGINSMRALLAVTAAGEDGRAWRTAGGASLTDYVLAETVAYDNAGLAGRATAALVYAGENPYLAGQRNLPALTASFYVTATGAYDAYAYLTNHALALWGLAAAGQPVPPAAVDWLLAQQNADGGWPWAGGLTSDSNSTAVAIQALVACGLTGAHPALQAATSYLRGIQSPDGGFPWDSAYGDDSDANSTANVIQALFALGNHPQRGWAWAQVSTDGLSIRKPTDRLLDLQCAEGAVEWMPGFGSDPLATIEAIPALMGVSYPVRSESLAAAQQALAWLKAQQQADGSFPSSWDPAGVTLDAMLAGALLGEDVGQWRKAGSVNTPLTYLAGRVETYATTPAATAKLIVALVAARQDPLAYAGHDLRARLLSQATGGVWGGTLADRAWPLLALASLRVPSSAAQREAVADIQNADGGWGWSPGQPSDSNSTGLALQALAAAAPGRYASQVASALAFLQADQTPDGGWAGFAGSPADPNSTAYVIQGLIAAGQGVRSAPWANAGGDPVSALLAMQLANGAYPDWQGNADVMATAQAIPGLLLEQMPALSRTVAGVRLPLARR